MTTTGSRAVLGLSLVPVSSPTGLLGGLATPAPTIRSIRAYQQQEPRGRFFFHFLTSMYRPPSTLHLLTYLTTGVSIS